MTSDFVPTTAADTRAAHQALSALTVCEVEGSLPADARRVLLAEADTLRAAIEANRHDHPRCRGDRAALAAAVAEARRVAAMWGVTI